LPDQHLGLKRQVLVGKDHVVGIGHAGVGGEAEGGEDGLAAAPTAEGEGVCPEEAYGAVQLLVGEAVGNAAVDPTVMML
jgi:hypothetical protein